MDTSEKQIKRIVLDRMERCSVCHRGFEPDDVHILSRKADMWMLMVSCEECHARNFVAAVIGDGDAEEATWSLRLPKTRPPTRSRLMTCWKCMSFCRTSTATFSNSSARVSPAHPNLHRA